MPTQSIDSPAAGGSNRASKVKAHILITMLCVTGMILGWYLPVVKIAELASWDSRLKLIADPGEADSRIRIIRIDQPSLDFYGDDVSTTWPFPRQMYAAVIQFLEAAGAKGVAFDLLFTEHSRLDAEDDKIFQDAVAGSLPVIIPVPGSQKQSGMNPDLFKRRLRRLHERQAREVLASRFAAYFDGRYAVPTYRSALLPIEGLVESAHRLGIVSALPDEDRVYRHYSPGAFIGDVPILGLPFALYDAVQGDRKEIDLDRYLDPSGRLTPRYHGPSGTYPGYSIADVISAAFQLQSGEKPVIDPAEFHDAWVFVGVWAPGMGDIRATSLDRVSRGVEVNATILDNLLNEEFVRHAAWYVDISLGVILIGSVTAISLFIRAIFWQIALTALALLSFLGLSLVLAVGGIWVSAVSAVLNGVLAVLLAYAYQYQVEGRKKRFLRKAFEHYISPDVIRQVVENPSKLALGGERRELSILFSDIAGFTSLSESLEVSSLMELLNTYLTAMTDIILEHNGTLDKYEGDAIIAFWNAPLEVPNHAESAVQAALRCNDRLEELQSTFEREYGVWLSMRIGIHTGLVNVGNFGSRERFNYTVIGDAANLAARLEGTNKFFGSTILISEATRSALDPSLPVRRLGTIRVVGRSEPVVVYEPLSQAQVSRDELDCFAEALTLFEEGSLSEASARFQELKQDRVSHLYLQRIERELERTAGNGKGTDEWSPIWNLEQK